MVKQMAATTKTEASVVKMFNTILKTVLFSGLME